MALLSDALMVLFYDIDGDDADHDDWHSREHFHERLSVNGFLRATRWVSSGAPPRYLVTYEVSDLGVATSEDYLARLNDPTPWTREMMPRFRGMTRGFCSVIASSGFGYGVAAAAVGFTPQPGAEASLAQWLAADVSPAMTERRGMVSAYLLKPAPPPPMTREQSLRGPDQPMPWLLLATAYEVSALDTAVEAHISESAFLAAGAAGEIKVGRYDLHCTASSDEAAR